MKILSVLIFCSVTICYSCNTSTTGSPEQIEQWKEEIVQIETEFAQMAADESIEAAFLAYAAEDAVLMRNNRLIEGIDAIRVRFEEYPMPDKAQLEWAPDFVDVSASGDMAYTYGRYTFSAYDSTGVKRESKGVFHTVWKKQADGSWKYVWD